MGKSEKNYGSSLKTNKYFIPIVSMIIYICAALIIIVGVKAVFGNQGAEDSTKIAANPAEEAYLNGKYDSSINEFTSLQEKAIWPDSMVKIAQIQSLQGNYIKSNDILQKTYETRNKVIDTKSSEVENIESKDKELGSDIIFTYFLNGEYKKSLEYGQFYLNIYPDDSKLKQTMFTIYLSNNETDKAKQLVKDYNVDRENAGDLVALAQMNFILGNYDDGLKILAQSWDVNKDSLKIFDSIDQINNKSELLDKAVKLQEKNKDNESYKAILSKIYSLSEDKKDKSLSIIKELKENGTDSANIDLLEYNILKDKDDENSNIIENLLKKYDESTFVGNYIRSLVSYDNKKYDDAFKYAKKCIIDDKNYNGTYYLIKEIKAAQQKPEGAEPFMMSALYNETYNYNNLIKSAEYYKSILKDSNKSLHYYELSCAVNNKNSEIYYNIGLIQINNQRNDEAINSIKKSISINGNVAKYYRTLGCIYLDKKDKQSSIDYIRKAYSIDENDILTLNDAAYYYASVDNNIDRAMTNIKSAYNGISDKTKEENKKIITDNYNRIKVAFDSSKKENAVNAKVSELKLIY